MQLSLQSNVLFFKLLKLAASIVHQVLQVYAIFCLLTELFLEVTRLIFAEVKLLFAKHHVCFRHQGNTLNSLNWGLENFSELSGENWFILFYILVNRRFALSMRVRQDLANVF